MDVDESGWVDLEERLGRSGHERAELRAVQQHLSDRLVSHFGVETVEIWLGKDGARHHSMQEVAAASIAHLLPLIDALSPEQLVALREAGEIGTPMPPPWDDHWRSQPRTAGWRS